MTKYSSLAIVLAVAASLPLVAGIQVEHDPAADFSSYATYTWKVETPAARAEIQQVIEETVDARLQAAGLRRVDGPADLRLETVAFAETSVGSTSSFYTSPTWSMGLITFDVRAGHKGFLLVTLVDGESDAPVWQALATKAFAERTEPEKAKRKVVQIIDKMFAKYPPR